MTRTFQLTGRGPEHYERHVVPLFFAPWAGPLLDLARPLPGERLLDVACGTGVVARAAVTLVGPHGSVTGLDLNPEMLAVARRISTVPAVSWQVGDAMAMPVPDDSFDVVTCQQGLQFCTDPLTALRDVRRVLVPGGRLALNVWRPEPFNPGFEALILALRRHVGDEAAAVMTAPFRLGDAERLRALLHQAGFPGRRVRYGVAEVRIASAPEFLRIEVAGTPLAALFDDLPAGTFEALEADLAESLMPYTDDHGVVFPMQTMLVAAG